MEVNSVIVSPQNDVVETSLSRSQKRVKLIDSIPYKKPFDLNAHIKRVAKRCREEYALYDELIESFATNKWGVVSVHDFEYRKPLDRTNLTLLQKHAVDDFSSMVAGKGYLCEYQIVDNGFGQRHVLVVTVK